MTRAEASRYTSSIPTAQSETTTPTRAQVSRYTSYIGNSPSALTDQQHKEVYDTLWSSMAYTGVMGIGGKTVDEARAQQEAAMAQLRGEPTVDTAAIITGGNIATRQQMDAMGFSRLDRLLINSGVQSASYELRYSSLEGTQLRINIDSRLRVGPTNVRTRLTFSEGENGQLVQTSADLGLNARMPRSAPQPSNVGGFAGLRFSDEGISATASASAIVRTPVGTTHGGSVSLTSPALRYNEIITEFQTTTKVPSPPPYASTNRPLSPMLGTAGTQSATFEIQRYLNSLQ